MTDAAKVLLVEDVERDAALVLYELRRAGLYVDHRRVYTEPDFRRELLGFGASIVLCDFKMPQFSGLTALRICRETDPDLPFIFVSGTMGEEAAVEAMKAGAVDYVMKTNLARLGPAVARELREVVVRRNRRLAESGLRRAQLMARLAHIVTGPGGAFERWSETLPELIRLDSGRLPATLDEWSALVHADDRARVERAAAPALARQARSGLAYRMLVPGQPEPIYIRHAMEPLDQLPDPASKTRWFHTIQDVTEQMLAEEKVKRLNRVYAVFSGISSAMIRVSERERLFADACRICVEQGQFRAGWIGTFEGDALTVSAHAFAAGLAVESELMPFARADRDRGIPAVVKELIARKTAIVCNRLEDDEYWWSDACAKHDIGSIAVFRLRLRGKALIVLALYAREADFFDTAEMQLLNALAEDVAFALAHLEQQDELRATERALREAVRARDEFLSIISHELTTPLASLRYQMQLFLRKREKRDPRLYAPGNVDTFVEQANRQTERLTRLVDDMLDVARIRSGRLKIERKCVSLSAVARDVISHLRPALERAGTPVELVAHQPGDGWWDRFRLEQVITNLLTNAMRYGDKKTVTVVIDSNDNTVRLTVRDRGIGIAKEAQEKIFDRFERSISPDEVSGLGLGLYITRQIVDAHGGRIWVESEGPGKGSAFVVELPVISPVKRLAQK